MSMRSASSRAAVSAAASSLLARGERLVHATAGLADELAELGLALGRDIAQPRVQLRERRALAAVRGAGGLERGGVGCRGDGVERGLRPRHPPPRA